MLKSFKNVLALVLALTLVMGTVGVVSADAATATVDGHFNSYFTVTKAKDSTGARLVESIVDVVGEVTQDTPGTETVVMAPTAIEKMGAAAGSVAKPMDLSTYSYDWIHDNPEVKISTYNLVEGSMTHTYNRTSGHPAAAILEESTSYMDITNSAYGSKTEQTGAIIDLGQVADIKYLQVHFRAPNKYGEVIHIYFSEDGKTWAPNTSGGLFVKTLDNAPSTNKIYWTNLTFTNPQKMRYIKLATRLNHLTGYAIRAWGTGSSSYEHVAFGTGNNRSTGGSTGNYKNHIDRDATTGLPVYTTMGGGGDAIGGRTYENRSYVYANFATKNTRVDKLLVNMGCDDTDANDSLNTLNNFSVYVSTTDGDGRSGGIWYEVYRRSEADGDSNVNPMDTIEIDVSNVCNALGGLDSVLIAKNTPAKAGECIRVANISALKKKGSTINTGAAMVIKQNTDTEMITHETASTKNTIHTVFEEITEEGEFTLVQNAMWHTSHSPEYAIYDYLTYFAITDKNGNPIDSTLKSFNTAWGPDKENNVPRTRLFGTTFDITRADEGKALTAFGFKGALGTYSTSGPDVAAAKVAGTEFYALFDSAYKFAINFPVRPKVILPNADTVVEIEDYTKLIGLDNEVISDSIASEGKAVYVYDENAAYNSSEYIKIPVNVQYAGTYTFTFGASWNGKGSKPTVTVGSKTLNVDNGGYIANKNLTTSHGAITNIRTYGSSAGNIELAAGEQYITVYLAKGDGEAWKTGGVAEAVLDYVKITPVDVEWDDPDAPVIAEVGAQGATIEVEDWVEGNPYTYTIVEDSEKLSGGKAVFFNQATGIPAPTGGHYGDASWIGTVLVEIPIKVTTAGTYKFTWKSCFQGSGISPTGYAINSKRLACYSTSNAGTNKITVDGTTYQIRQMSGSATDNVSLTAGEHTITLAVLNSTGSAQAIFDAIVITPVQ